MIYYTDKYSIFPVTIFIKPYNPPIVEKDQQDPQEPYALVGKTAPFLYQST